MKSPNKAKIRCLFTITIVSFCSCYLVAVPADAAKAEKSPNGPSEDAVVMAGSKDLETFNFTPKAKTKKAQDIKDYSHAEKAPESGKLSESLQKLNRDICAEADKVDELIYKRGALYENEEVNEYLNKVAARIKESGETGQGEPINIKVKMIRDPTVNAIALPNNTIYIHTGALARLENEAQLASLLGHEISHLRKMDNLYNTESRHNKTIAYKLFDIVLAPTSVFFGILGDLVQMGFGLLYATSVTGYAREIEARADEDALSAAASIGYHPGEVAGLPHVFLRENEKYDKGIEIFFLMNHPTNEWRLKNLKEKALKKYRDNPDGIVKSEEFLHNMVKIKLYNATLNIKMDRLEHAKDNIMWVLEKFPNNPEAHYLAGEIYRSAAEDRNKLKYELNAVKWRELNKNYKEGELEQIWQGKAREEFEFAIEIDPQYANAYKGLGILYFDKKDNESAKYNLRRYIEFSPIAQDRRFINNLIDRIERSENEKQIDKENGG